MNVVADQRHSQTETRGKQQERQKPLQKTVSGNFTSEQIQYLSGINKVATKTVRNKNVY